MGIKGTDDYLTIRFANPATGLVTPSIDGQQSPRTPLTPGDALRLYSGGQDAASGIGTSSPDGRPRPGLYQRAQQYKHQRWRRGNDRWLTEPYSAAASPRMSAAMANSSAARRSLEPVDERFAVAEKMSLSPARRQECAAAPHQSTESSRHHLSEKSLDDTSDRSAEKQYDLRAKVPSIGAGPKKFVLASRALRMCSGNANSAEPPSSNDKAKMLPRQKSIRDLTSSTNPIGISTPITAGTFAPFESPRTLSNGSADSVMTAMRSMPGSFDDNKASTTKAQAEDERNSGSPVKRKAVGSPAFSSRTGRSSEADLGPDGIATTERIRVVETHTLCGSDRLYFNDPPSKTAPLVSQSPVSRPDYRSRPDGRQGSPHSFTPLNSPSPVPRTSSRMGVYTDFADQTGCPADHLHPGRGHQTWPQLPQPQAYASHAAPRLAKPRTHTSSALETQLLGALITLYTLLTLPVHWLSSAPPAHPTQILHSPHQHPDHQSPHHYFLSQLSQAIPALASLSSLAAIGPSVETLSSPTASPEQRVAALRDLLAATGRIVVLLTAVATVWRVVVAVKDVLEVLLWPVRVVGGLVGWVAG